MAHLLGAEAVHLAYPTQVVFEAVTLGVNDGARIGIVGRNGDGKSSLLGLLTGQLRPDSGRVTRRSGLRVNALSQTDTLDPNRTVGWTLIGDQPEHQWAGNPRIRDVVAGLVSDIAWDTPVSTLSGGQRRRVQLASLLVGEWDVIALDEPTNHLDIQGITWLADHLRRRWARNTGGLLVVTHDRWFLDEVATTTWEVHDGIVEPFEGGYAAYVLQRVERDRLTAAAEAKRQNLLRKELAWLRRGAPARTCKPKFRIEAANQLIADVPPPRNTVELAKLAAARLGKDVVDLLGVSVSYQPSGGRPVLRDIEWRIGPGERIGIVGANGAGKSTLLGLIAGTVQPGVGRVKTRQDRPAGSARSARGRSGTVCRRPDRRCARQAAWRLSGRRPRGYPDPAARASRVPPGPAVRASRRPLRWSASAVAAHADAVVRAERAAPRRAHQRRGHRDADGDRRPA
ncbi:elongation factor 3 [Mycobacterium tuberculosis]|nr:elongation factor 3 [Mycobacterium tuberculosis]